jgi:hypothetical protein
MRIRAIPGQGVLADRVCRGTATPLSYGSAALGCPRLRRQVALRPARLHQLSIDFPFGREPVLDF